MQRNLQIALRTVGIALVAFAAIHFLLDSARSLETEEHATSDGFVIHHTIVISSTTSAAALGGAVLFGLSFIRLRKLT
jgi:hypothetical protein